MLEGGAKQDVLRVLAQLGRECTLDDVIEQLRASGTPTLASTTQEALRQSEERFRLIFESSALGIALVGHDARPIRCNPALERMLGYSEAELVRMTFPEFTHPDDVKLDWDLYGELIAGKRSHYQIDKRYLRKDARVVWARLTVSLVAGAPGEHVVGIGMVEDVTARRLAEESLRRSEEQLGLALSAADLGFWEWDVDADRMLWSAQMERLAGLAPGTFVGTYAALEAILHPDDRQAVKDAIRSTLRSPKLRDHYDADFRFVLPSGETRWLTCKGQVYRDASGRGVRMLGMALDTTERRVLEEQLRQAQKMDAIGGLAGGIAHDFNNLLTVISANCHLLRESQETPASSLEIVADIHEAAERGAGLTRQLLAFSRKTVLQPTVLELDLLVRQLEGMLRRLLGANVVLESRLGAVSGYVRADATHLEQVVMNLVVNARDAMPTGGRLAIESRRVTLGADYASQHPNVRPGPYVLLAVSDTGCGMDKATLSRIFEPFFTTKPPGKGTGLGLAVVFGIVQQSEGHLVAESEPGRGTTFRVYLPEVDPEKSSTPVSLPPNLPSGTETVLLVEDEPALRRLLRAVLEAQGYTVLDAASAAEALTIVAGIPGPIDLLLTDLVLPGMSGRELSEAVRQVRPKTKLLLVSGYTDDSLVHHGVKQDEVNFLQKPFSPTALARKVRESLDR